MDTNSLTYQDIDQLEKSLSDPDFKKSYTYDEIIIRLLIQVLRNNRWLADQIASADMRSRLAFGEAREANEQMKKLMEKNKKDFEFLINSPQQTDKFKNKKKWTGGIDV